MAYTQMTGREPLKNKKFEELTNGTPLRQQSRLQNALDKADKKSKDDGGTRYYSGDFGGGGNRRVASGRNRDILSYATTFVKEMVSPSEPTKEETKGSGFGGRGY